MNTVPLVGLKNNQIVYLATKSSPLSKDGTTEAWKYFSAPPDGVTLDASSNVRFFPYHAHFYMSVGTAVWRKKHRDPEDKANLAKAVDDWSKMYVDEWEKIGDTALPAANLRDVVPFAVLSADRNTYAFNLVILNQDGSAQVLMRDDLYAENKWSTLTYTKGDNNPDQPPKWSRMAYWNNTILALDDSSNMWSLEVDFDKSTYKIGEKTAINPTTEFTATDLGPVVLRADGYLYKRLVAEPPSDGTDPPLQWTQWVLRDGVTNLGVAAPGVVLDLQTLTRTLKSRYIQTQTALYPVVNRISAFATTHGIWLDRLMKASAAWSNAPNAGKQAIAIKEGKNLVVHAQVWAKMLSSAIGGSKESVNIMTAQLHDVKTQLEIQLQILRDKLVGLQNTLKVQKDALSKLKAAFWGSIGAMFLGMAIGVIALATGIGAPLAVAAGALFLGGFVATIALGVQMSKLAGEVSDTQIQIVVTNTAITQLAEVVKNFKELDSLYGTLNVFWGRMWNNAVSLQQMDNATVEQIGMDILGDPSSIIAAQDVTKEIGDAATTYLDTLNNQGIHVGSITTPVVLSTFSVEYSILSDPNAIEGVVSAQLEHGAQALKAGNVPKYFDHMEQAFVAAATALNAANNDQLQSGDWCDIPRLSGAAQLFNATPAMLNVFNGISEIFQFAGIGSQADIQNRVNVATPIVVNAIQKTTAMCVTIQDLLARYKELSEAGDRKGIDELKDTVLKKAINECESAGEYSAQANNAFVDVNRACTDYQQTLERQEGEWENTKRSAAARANADIGNLNPPWDIFVGGPLAIAIYMEQKTKEINDQLSRQLRDADNALQQLKIQLSSGASMNGHSLTWTEMAQMVSGCLGKVFNILTAVYGQVLEDPKMYDSLLKIEWASVEKNFADVLNILASRGINVQPGTRATIFAKGVRGVSSDKAVGALSAPTALGAGMASQAKQAQDFFSGMQTLLELPYLDDIVGYWDVEQTEKTTLLAMATKLRGQYVDMMSTEYGYVQNIFTMSLLQGARAELVRQGRLETDVLVSSSLVSAQRGQALASAVAKKFKAASADYQTALKQVEANLVQIKQKLQDIDKDIDDLKKAEREKIINLIADVVALSFATAIIFASAGYLGPVATALTTAAKLGLGATATAATIKTVVDGLSLSEIGKLLSTMHTTRSTLQTSLIQLQAVRPLFGKVVNGAELLETAVDDMATELQDLINDIDLLRTLNLSDNDVRGIARSWEEVKEFCLNWMDAVNAQGIRPAMSL